MHVPLRTRVCVAVSSAVLTSRVARAQSSAEEIVRSDLVTRAEAARGAGHHAEALDLAARAGTIRMTASLRQFIAYEREAAGQVLEALDASLRCVREAEVDASLRNRAQILDACRALRDRLQPRVGRLHVQVEGVDPARVRLTVNGREVDRALWRVGYPVMPGDVLVSATAGEARVEREVTVVAGADVDETLRLDAPPPAAPPPVAPPPVATQPVVSQSVATQPVVSPRPAAPSLAGPVSLLTVGGVSLLSAVVFAVLRDDAQAARDAECDAMGVGRCDPVANQHDEAFRDYTVATDVALGVGVAGAAAGAVWLGLSLRGRTHPATAWVAPSIRDGRAGVVVYGAW